jgi:hypothetical protein
MSAPELLPCPFCGGIPEGPIDATRILGVWRLVHRGCCTLPNFSVEKSTPEAAIAAWNRRAASPAVAAHIAAAVQAERDAAQSSAREMHRRAQTAEGKLARTTELLDLILETMKIDMAPPKKAQLHSYYHNIRAAREHARSGSSRAFSVAWGYFTRQVKAITAERDGWMSNAMVAREKWSEQETLREAAEAEVQALRERAEKAETELSAGSFYKESDIDALMARAEAAEAERDALAARVAAMVEAGVGAINKAREQPIHSASVKYIFGVRCGHDRSEEAIRALTPADAQAALDAMISRAREEALAEAAAKVLSMQREVDETNERFAKAKLPGVCMEYEADDYAAAIRAITQEPKP